MQHWVWTLPQATGCYQQPRYMVLLSSWQVGLVLMDTDQSKTGHMVMRMEFSYTQKTTIFTFLCILALFTAYLQTGYASTQGYTSTTLAPSDVILPRDWSLFL